MYKLVIADDDEILLRGLTEKIQWEKFGIEVVASVDNGILALYEVKKYNADILLTDIRMPSMDGIELIGHIKEYNDTISVIIISAHDEFEYAHEAIKKGADNYLLKPINIELLEAAINSVILDKENRSAIINKLSQVDELQSEKKDYNRFKMYYDLLLEALPKEDFHSKYKQFLPKEENNYFRTVVLRFKDVKKEEELKQLQNLNIEANNIQKKMGLEDMCILGIHRSLIIIDYAISKKILNARLQKMREALRRYVRDNNKKSKLIFQSGPIIKNFIQLNESYKKALQMGELCYINDYGLDIEYEEPKINLEEDEEIFRELVDNIVKMTLISKNDKLKNSLSVYEENIRRYGKKAKMILSHTLSIIFLLLFEECDKIGIDIDKVIGGTVNTINEILIKEKLKDSINLLFIKLCEVEAYINIQNNHVNKQLMIKAFKYIEDQYDNPDVRLVDVANHVGLSKNYFSNVFKSISNKSFTDYLRDFRMDYAEKLLSSTNHKGYEVSYMVGYNNPTYFSSTFKKYSGYSPLEFKKKNNKQ